MLPKNIDHVIIPPIKCQGIKTKLIKFIASNIKWSVVNGRWVEPFLGSGSVLFNIQPKKALISDSNEHIIRLYQNIQSDKITGDCVRSFLNVEAIKLLNDGEYYYEVRKRFNAQKDSLDFLFLNRACFNGVMRFNKKGYFNVPFCKKPDRFRQAYITKIVNQVKVISGLLHSYDWEFVCQDWRNTLSQCGSDDLLYIDPPYIGRHTDYFNSWSEQDADELAEKTQEISCGFALSMWLKNCYRENIHIEKWAGNIQRTFSHFYHVGATESLRNAVEEVLIIKNGFAS
jgi:DNA adenine methylase